MGNQTKELSNSDFLLYTVARNNSPCSDNVIIPSFFCYTLLRLYKSDSPKDGRHDESCEENVLSERVCKV